MTADGARGGEWALLIDAHRCWLPVFGGTHHSPPSVKSARLPPLPLSMRSPDPVLLVARGPGHHWRHLVLDSFLTTLCWVLLPFPRPSPLFITVPVIHRSILSNLHEPSLPNVDKACCPLSISPMLTAPINPHSQWPKRSSLPRSRSLHYLIEFSCPTTLPFILRMGGHSCPQFNINRPRNPFNNSEN